MPTLRLTRTQWSLYGRNHGGFPQLRLLHVRYFRRDFSDNSSDEARKIRERLAHSDSLEGSKKQSFRIHFYGSDAPIPHRGRGLPRGRALELPKRLEHTDDLEESAEQSFQYRERVPEPRKEPHVKEVKDTGERSDNDTPPSRRHAQSKQNRRITPSELMEEHEVKSKTVRHVFDEDDIDGVRLTSRARVEEKAIPWRGIQNRHSDFHDKENDHFAADSEYLQTNPRSSGQRQSHEDRSKAATSIRNTDLVQNKQLVRDSSPRSPPASPKRALSLLDSVARGQATKMGRRSQEEELNGSGTSKTSARITYDLPKGSERLQVHGQQSSPPTHTLSLFEELFPEEAKDKLPPKGAGDISQQNDNTRLPLPDFDALDSSHVPLPTSASKLIAQEAMVNAFRHDNRTVLVLSGASRSLVESDFRRIAPKGIHIDEWRGLGDILKVLPARNPNTLEPEPHYFLIFNNPSYARMYQNYVIHLDQLAKVYTPTSYASPIMPPPGMLIKGENVYTLLQDFTLCASSQKLSIRLLQPPYGTSIASMLRTNGYPRIVSPIDKSGRSVLFWVNGRTPSKLLIKEMLDNDGMNRGLIWGPQNGKGSIEAIKSSDKLNEEAKNSHSTNGIERKQIVRWIITLENENEARRFVRTWHQLPFPFPSIHRDPNYEEPLNLIHAEFLW